MRQREIFETFPDALDLMTVCVEAGLGTEAAHDARWPTTCSSRARSWPTSCARQPGTARRRDRERALRNLAIRTGVEEVDGFVTMINQAERFGTSIAASLRVHADMLRTRRRQRAEEAAAKIALKLLFPLIFCIFPSLDGRADGAGHDPDLSRAAADHGWPMTQEQSMRPRHVPQPFASTPARAVASVTALVMAGCATPTPEAWRVVPSYRVTHAGTGAAQGYLALARKYEGEGRVGLALVAWRKAALEAPDDVEILDALGIAEAGQGFHDRAVAALRRASALAPPRAARLNNLGYALLLDGRTDEARRVLLEALALEPQHAQAQTNLSRLEPIAVVAAVAMPLPNSVSVANLQTAASPQPADGIRLITQPTTGPLPLSSPPGTSAMLPVIATEAQSTLSEEAHPREPARCSHRNRQRQRHPRHGRLARLVVAPQRPRKRNAPEQLATLRQREHRGPLPLGLCRAGA